jgi:hypothetical protein
MRSTSTSAWPGRHGHTPDAEAAQDIAARVQRLDVAYRIHDDYGLSGAAEPARSFGSPDATYLDVSLAWTPMDIPDAEATPDVGARLRRLDVAS